MPFSGGGATLSFFVGVSPVLQHKVPSGPLIDPRYNDIRLFPYEDMEDGRPWTLIFELRPDDPLVKPSELEVRLADGNVLETKWSKETKGRWFLKIPFEELPPGAKISIYDYGELRIGPLPVYHALQVTPDRVASVRGMVMRHAMISDGDQTAVVFTLVDKEGYGLPPNPDLISLELHGLVQRP